MEASYPEATAVVQPAYEIGFQRRTADPED
jgi:hypothetical protein